MNPVRYIKRKIEIKTWKKSKVITVRIRDLYSPAYTSYKTLSQLKEHLKKPDAIYSNYELEYNWERLENSIKTYGVINPIRVSTYRNNSLYNYYIEDGNHRYFICKILYGLDYKISIKTCSNDA